LSMNCNVGFSLFTGLFLFRKQLISKMILLVSELDFRKL
jgi:hypothetical protein